LLGATVMLPAFAEIAQTLVTIAST